MHGDCHCSIDLNSNQLESSSPVSDAMNCQFNSQQHYNTNQLQVSAYVIPRSNVPAATQIPTADTVTASAQKCQNESKSSAETAFQTAAATVEESIILGNEVVSHRPHHIQHSISESATSSTSTTMNLNPARRPSRRIRSPIDLRLPFFRGISSGNDPGKSSLANQKIVESVVFNNNNNKQKSSSKSRFHLLRYRRNNQQSEQQTAEVVEREAEEVRRRSPSPLVVDDGHPARQSRKSEPEIVHPQLTDDFPHKVSTPVRRSMSQGQNDLDMNNGGRTVAMCNDSLTSSSSAATATSHCRSVSPGLWRQMMMGRHPVANGSVEDNSSMMSSSFLFNSSFDFPFSSESYLSASRAALSRRGFGGNYRRSSSSTSFNAAVGIRSSSSLNSCGSVEFGITPSTSVGEACADYELFPAADDDDDQRTRSMPGTLRRYHHRGSGGCQRVRLNEDQLQQSLSIFLHEQEVGTAPIAAVTPAAPAGVTAETICCPAAVNEDSESKNQVLRLDEDVDSDDRKCSDSKNNSLETNANESFSVGEKSISVCAVVRAVGRSRSESNLNEKFVDTTRSAVFSDDDERRTISYKRLQSNNQRRRHSCDSCNQFRRSMKVTLSFDRNRKFIDPQLCLLPDDGEEQSLAQRPIASMIASGDSHNIAVKKSESFDSGIDTKTDSVTPTRVTLPSEGRRPDESGHVTLNKNDDRNDTTAKSRSHRRITTQAVESSPPLPLTEPEIEFDCVTSQLISRINLRPLDEMLKTVSKSGMEQITAENDREDEDELRQKEISQTRRCRIAELRRILCQPEQMSSIHYMRGLFDSVYRTVRTIDSSDISAVIKSSAISSCQESVSTAVEISAAETRETLLKLIGAKLYSLEQEKVRADARVSETKQLLLKVSNTIGSRLAEQQYFKYRLYIDELAKVLHLLLMLAGRLARVELEIANMDVRSLSPPTDDDKQTKKALLVRRQDLLERFDDAVQLKSGIDRRREPLDVMLRTVLKDTEMNEHDRSVTDLSRTTLDARWIEDRIELARRQLQTVMELDTCSWDVLE